MSTPARADGEAGPAAGAVLVTGATGFVGSNLARRLSAEGRRVRCLVRPTSDTTALAELAVELAQGDLGDEASLRRAAAGCEEIVHCAALVSDWATVAEIRDANVAGTRNLLSAASAADVRRVVHISTTDVYGHPGGGPVGEDQPAGRFANWYAQSKLEAERELSQADGSPEIVILRPATVYGPGSKELVGEIARAIEAHHMLLVGRGRAVAGLCYVENLLDAIVQSLGARDARGEVFNVSDGLPVTWSQFTADLATGLGAPPVRLSLPYPAAMAVAVALEHGYRLARRATGVALAPLLSRQAVQVLGRDQCFSAAKAERVLGWTPRIGYAEGMRATIEWLARRPPAVRGRSRHDSWKALDAAGV